MYDVLLENMETMFASAGGAGEFLGAVERECNVSILLFLMLMC